MKILFGTNEVEIGVCPLDCVGVTRRAADMPCRIGQVLGRIVELDRENAELGEVLGEVAGPRVLKLVREVLRLREEVSELQDEVDWCDEVD